MPLYTAVCGYMRCKIGGPEPRNSLQSPDPLELHEKRAAPKSCSFWRRTWDSNPRGCYTLLAFQASSLATRSILHISVHELIYHKIKGFARGKLTKPQKLLKLLKTLNLTNPVEFYQTRRSRENIANIVRRCGLRVRGSVITGHSHLFRSRASRVSVVSVSGAIQLPCPERFGYRVRSASATVSSIWLISMTPL